MAVRGSGRRRRTVEFVEGARAVLPLALASVWFGISFGLLARTSGLGKAEPIVMSATAFTGSAQFAAVSVLDSGGTALAAIAAAALANARYAAMGLALASSFHGSALSRLLQAQFIVDESWAVAMTPSGRGVAVRRLIGAGSLMFAGWVGGTVVGSLGAQFVPAPDRLGLDAAFPALFLALLGSQLRARGGWPVAILASAIALVLIPFTSPGVPVLVAAAACLMGWRRA